MPARAVMVPYRSSRPLRGRSRLGDLTSAGSTASSYSNYAKAIYQALKGDVVGGAYSAALTFAGPIAAIGNAVADYLNRTRDKKAAITQEFLDALVREAGFGQVIIGKAGYRYLTPDGTRLLNPDQNANALANAIYKGDPPEAIAQMFVNWLNAGSPYKGGYTVLVQPRALPEALSDTQASAPGLQPVIPASSPPAVVPAVISPVVSTPVPAPVISMPPVLPDAPAPPPAPVTLAPTNDAPAITVNVPSSVPPDQTPALIAQLMNQGASSSQAAIAALQSLAARGVPASPQVQSMVARDVSTPQASSVSWMVLGLIVLAGTGLMVRNFR